VGRPHGTEGAFHVVEATERSELLADGRSVRVGGREAVIERRRGTSSSPILKLEGVDERSGAAALKGAAISVPRAAIGALAEGEYLSGDLVALDVVADGERVGRVRDVLFLPSVEALEVEWKGGRGTVLVPLVSDAIERIDLARRRVELNRAFLEPASGAEGA
jgi:16S rRNA processing protein RimM